MIWKFIYILSLSALIHSCGTSHANKYNFDFEQVEISNKKAKGWFRGSDYEIITDENAGLGKYSGKIFSNEKGVEGRMLYGIPACYSGENIQLEGYIKTKNVREGFAGLFLKIESEKGFNLAFKNMEEVNLIGTNDWKKYSISIPYPENAEYIFIGGLLSGKGEAWFDNFSVKIDGSDIQSLKENGKEIFKAKLDREFDVGSNVEIPALENKTVINLDLLGKIWGFLKYYHPEITKGDYNWDFELFRFLPKYLDAKTEIIRDEILINWINGYGEIKECLGCEKTSNAAILKPDFSWIDESNISKELESLLFNIYNNRSQGKQYYVDFMSYVGNPIFLNENPYSENPFPDKGYRLLALFRYWNAIQYFFPYKNITDIEWNKVQKKYIDQIVNAKNELEYELVFLKLIGEIVDTHSSLRNSGNRISNLRGKYFSTYKVQFIEKKLVVTGYYNRKLINNGELKIGDIITHVDNVPVEVLVDSLNEYYPASNNTAKMRNISSDILRSKTNKLLVNYSSDSLIKKRELKLFKREDLIDRFSTNSKKSFKLIDNNIGYITLESIKEKDIAEIKKTFSKTKGIVIDIRNYPNTFVPYLLGSYFVSKETPFVKFTKVNPNNPGEFNFAGSLKIKPDADNLYDGKLVVLVNEFSQSQSEFTAMAFRAGINTTIIGSTTAGADGNVSNISIPGGLSSSFSGIGVYYPNGKKTQRVGIIPDIVIEPTIKGIKLGRDELLEKAIEIIEIIEIIENND